MQTYFCDFSVGVVNTAQQQLLRIIVDEVTSWDFDEIDVKLAYEHIIEADEENENSEFYGTLESALSEFEKLPFEFAIETNINGEIERYEFEKVDNLLKVIY